MPKAGSVQEGKAPPTSNPSPILQTACPGSLFPVAYPEYWPNHSLSGTESKASCTVMVYRVCSQSAQIERPQEKAKDIPAKQGEELVIYQLETLTEDPFESEREVKYKSLLKG